MARLPSRFRRLDEILADLPMEDPPLLTEVDGYLTGIAVSPAPIPPDEWLPPIWGGGYGEAAPFEDPLDVQLFAEMVRARHGEILRDLGRGKLQPIFDVDERNGDVLWEEWIEGFAVAMDLRPEAWAALADASDPAIAAAAAYLRMLAEVTDGSTTLDSIEINAICDAAAGSIAAQVSRLHRPAEAPPVSARPAKTGRNDPCPCGSGKKYKRCCAKIA
jgi:uncharacterized protein